MNKYLWHHTLEGFSLLELLISLSTCLIMTLVIGDSIIAEQNQASIIARNLRESSAGNRMLELMKIELQEAQSVTVKPRNLMRSGCGLTGRVPILHMNSTQTNLLSDFDITYTLESKPDPIWRGSVLMRCGPPYGLNGQIEDSISVSRVWTDSIPSDGFQIQRINSNVLRIKLTRFFKVSGKSPQLIHSQITAFVPGLIDQ